jgi:hypothetical protein
MSFSAGAITGSIGLDISEYSHSMLEATSIAHIFPSTVTSFLASPLLGLVDIAKRAGEAIVGAFTSVGRAADNAGEAAERAGVSVEFLTSVGAAAKDSGSSVQGLGDALKFLNNNAADAASGNEQTAKNFTDLGVSVTSAGGKLKGTEALFFELADAIAKLPTAAQKTQAAMNLLGRGGVDMIPTLNKGSASIKEFAAQITELGGAIGTDLAAAGDKFGALETFVGAAWDGIKKSVAQPILQYVADHFEEILVMVKGVAGQVRQAAGGVGTSIVAAIPDLLKFAGAVASGVVKALQALATVAAFVARHLDALKAVLGAAGLVLAAELGMKAIGGLAGAFATLIPQLAAATAAQTAFNAARAGLLTAGIGAAVGGIAGDGGMGSLAGGAGGGILGRLIGGLIGSIFGPLGTLIGQWVGALGGAVAGGKVGTALGGGGSGGGTRIEQVNVTVPPVDTNEASSQIAAKIRPGLQEGIKKQKKQLHAARSAELVLRSL